jgi:hypothetical protein
MSSWKGQVTVSGEWEGQYYDHDAVLGILEDVVGLMLSLTQNN